MLAAVRWLMVAELLLYGLAIAALAIIFLPLLMVWRAYHLDFSVWIVICVGLAYPLYYAAGAAASMVAVFPVASSAKVSVLRGLASRSNLGKLYVFYALRIGIELLLVVVVPLALSPLAAGRVLGSVSIALGLMIPFTLLQGAAYQLKLNLLSADPTVQRLFTPPSHRLRVA